MTGAGAPPIDESAALRDQLLASSLLRAIGRHALVYGFGLAFVLFSILPMHVSTCCTIGRLAPTSPTTFYRWGGAHPCSAAHGDGQSQPVCLRWTTSFRVNY